MEAKQFTQTVGPYTPIYYAGASGDFNAIHIDDNFSKAVGLGSKILQGLCTMAYAQRLAANSTEGEDPGNLKRLVVRFNLPVRPKDKLTFEGAPGGSEDGKSTLGITAKNQNGEEVLTSAFAEVAG